MDLQPTNHARTLNDVAGERARQLKLKTQGRFKYTPSEVADFEALAMLSEEVGEVARNCLRRGGFVIDGNPSNAALYKELIQVAAVALAWAEQYVEY